MTDISTIYKSKVITTETDIFWSEKHIVKAMQPKNVLIISKMFSDGSKESTQFNKILEACSLDPTSINLIQLTEKEQIAWQHLKQHCEPAVIILFGIHPKNLGISALFRLNSINNFDNVKWIPTLSLSELEQKPEVKKTLWQNALKPVFAD